jgi:tRNA(fMet)-specific endonuclease VapC
MMKNVSHCCRGGSVVAGLSWTGCHRIATVGGVARVEALQFEVLDFDREDARHSGEVRATLAAAGTPIGPYDVLIAGQAIARGLTLITHNTREFLRVPQIRVEDWEV